MSAKQKIYRLTLRSNPRQIGRVEPLLKKVQKGAHLDEIQFHKLMVSLTEAVNNAILHGNKSDETKKVTVRCELQPGWLVATIEDEGQGFKPEKVRNPLSKRNLLKANGRGIFLMRTLMDKVEYDIRNHGARVILWLALKK